MNACLYHRVSTVDQDPTLARDELTRAATQRGYAIAATVEETGSGARNDRPGLRQVMALAQSGSVSTVLVWKLDRFGRSAMDLLANIKSLTDAGCEFVAVTQGLHLKPHGDAMGRLILTVLAAVAEFERDLIIERTREGLKKRRTRPGPVGLPPSTVREIVKMRGAGLSWRAIARRLPAYETAGGRRPGRLVRVSPETCRRAHESASQNGGGKNAPESTPDHTLGPSA